MKVSAEVHAWWETLRQQLGSGEDGAGSLYRYDPDTQSLLPAFPQAAGFDDVPPEAVAEAYEAAKKGRMGASRPDIFTPCAVTADPDALLKEAPDDVRQKARELVTGLLDKARQLVRQSQKEPVSDREREPRTDSRLSSVREAVRLTSAVCHMPVSREFQGETNDLIWQIAILAAQAETLRVQRLRDEEDEQQKAQDRTRRMQAALIMAQRAREAMKEDALDVLLPLRENLAEWETPEDEPTEQEKEQANSYLGLLSKKNLTDEAQNHQLVDDIVMGKTASDHRKQLSKAEKEPSPVRETPPKAEDSGPRGEMLGNALRQFIQYAASEVPLSAKHAETGRLCRTFWKMAEEEHLSPKELGLSSQEYTAVLGTIELGKVVKRGLEAEHILFGDKPVPPRQKALALRDYLSMKALEQALAPHVAAHQAAIEAGDGPLSSIQLLMGNPGFSARDIHRMVSQSGAMAELLAAPADKLPALLGNSRKMAELGRQAMIACYDSGLRRDHTAKPHVKENPHTAKGPVRKQ